VNVRTWGAWTIAGIALWASVGELDVTGGAAGVVRLAMLPPVPVLGAAVLLAWITGALLRLGSRSLRPADSVMPLYALGVLVVPYLPWVPDVVPVLRVFAGPLRYFIWIGIIAQVVWAEFGSGRGRRVVVLVRSWSAVRLYTTVCGAGFALFTAAALVLAPTGLVPGGDEPHYLIITQSLLQDRDLDIENNHRQEDYRRYFSEDLEAHALARGVDGKLYSVHPIGLPLLIVPFFAIGGYPAVVLAMLLMASAAASLAWVWVRRLTGSVSAATFSWAAASLSVSFLFSAGTVYPEIPAALAVMLACAVGLRASPLTVQAPTLSRALLIGGAAGLLPWLGSKYAVMSAALVAVAAARLWRERGRGPKAARVAALVMPYAGSIAAWFAFFAIVWGSPSPSAAYGGADQTQMSLWNLHRGVPGLLFDQEYGLLAYAPALALAVWGLWHQWRAGGAPRIVALEVSLVFGALLATVAGHQMWWGGSSMPARFLVSGVLLLAAPVAWEYRRVGARPDRRAAYRLLLLAGLAASLAAAASPNVSALANRRDGVSKLLSWLSPDWHAWAFAPDFIAQSPGWGLLQSGLWIGAIAACAWGLTRPFVGGPRKTGDTRVGRGLAFLRADAALLVAVVLVTLAMPPLMRDRLKPGIRPEVVDAASIPGMFELAAQPGSRRHAQPVPVFLNARFGLPAGRYRVVLSPHPGGTPLPLSGGLTLQGGRHGGTLAAWSVAASGGSRWSETFDLPVDLSFVGFRADGHLADATGDLRLVPVRVVPTLDRTAGGEVLGAATLGERFVFLFHDGGSFPESGGFWVRGAAPAAVSVLSRTGPMTVPVQLRLRNGPVANTVHIVTPGFATDVALAPGETREVRLAPTPLDGTLRMIIRPAGGFVPAEHEPGNRDTRLLGCWVEVVG